MDHNEQPPPNERTPLLRSSSTAYVTAIQNGPYFCDTPITPCIEQLKSNLAETLRRGQDTLSPLYPHFPEELQDSSAEIGHFLICLLSVRQSELLQLRERGEDPLDASASASRGMAILDKAIADLWKDEVVSTRRDDEFLESALWTVFPVSRGVSTRRVIDYLHGPDAPQYLVLSPEVLHNVSRVWGRGFMTCYQHNVGSSSAGSLIQRCSSYCTPRATYSAHLVADLLFTALLAHYVVDPPALHALGLSFHTAREIVRDTYLIVYSFAALVHPSTGLTSTFTFVLLSFLFSYPELPIPGYGSFNLLLLSFFFRLVDYHRAYTPSPIFLFQPSNALPLVHIFGFHINCTLVPLMLFLLPVSILVFVLLAYSNAFDLDTRLVFAFALVVIFCVFIFLLLSFAPSSNTQLANSSSSSSTTIRHPLWDRYSQQIGLEARKAFIRCVAAYGRWYLFPPPFNALQLVFVVLPRGILSILRTQYRHGMDKVEQTLWRVSAGPLVMTLGLLWSWMSPAPRAEQRDGDRSNEEP